MQHKKQSFGIILFCYTIKQKILLQLINMLYHHKIKGIIYIL